MHELPFAKSILKSVLAKAEANEAKAVKLVAIEVGVLRDFVPEIVKKYWYYVTKGTIAEGSEILMRELPATAKCDKCGTIYEINVHDIANTRCSNCGYDYGKLLTGRELRIVGIEII